LSGGSWVEIDEPQIIKYKNRRLPVDVCPNRLSRISIDFAYEPLASKLSEIVNANPVVFVVEGVFMYLDAASVENTIGTIARLFPSHTLYCDLMTKDFFQKYAQSIHSKLAAAGGHISALSNNPESMFTNRGYETAEHTPMFKRAGELGILWQEAKIPRFISNLMLHRLAKDLAGYAVHRFLFDYDGYPVEKPR
jgi:O-methyltransferase involved in polyketide biosynthesis